MKNSSGTLVASAFLHGIGTGPALHAFPAAISTLAGSGVWGYSDGAASTASFRNPQGVAVDLQGDIYVADSINMVVRKITAGSNAVSTVAGTGSPGYAGDNGLATSAKLNNPTGVAVDAAGNLFIADQQNGLIRRVDAVTRIITTVAGGGSSTASGVAATSASLSGPADVVVDSAGNLYIADSFHSLVRKVAASTAVITTVAGGGTSAGNDGLGDGSAADTAHLNNPTGLALDSAGNLFIADTGDSLIRRVDASTGIITAVAGNGSNGHSGDGGPATSAELASPMGIRVDPAGNLYIADFQNNTVRMVSAQSGNISTIAGTGTATYSGNGGTATSANLSNPTDLVLDPSGNLLIADNGNNVIRKVAFQPPTIAFPSTNVSLDSALVYIQIQNFGNASLNFSSLSLSLPFHQQASQGTDCSSSSVVVAGAACNIDVYFAPTSNITFTGALTASTNSNNQSPATFTANLTGIGISGTPVATVTPSSLTFATTAVGSSSAAQVVTLKNTGTATLSSISIVMAGQNPSDFPMTTTCASTLAAASSCTVNVSFKPLLSGVRAGTLSFFSNASGSPQSVTLTGTGTGGALPVFSPSALSFGSEFLNSASSAMTATLTNSGAAALSIYGISIGGTDGGDFNVLSSTCTSSLAASASCTVVLNFSPTASGTRTASLLVGDSAGNSPQSLPLTGTGTTVSLPALSTTSLTFGSQPQYSSATPLVTTLTSTSAVSLGIAGASITGPNSADFAINQVTCGSTLAPASSCSVTIGFTPTALGTRTATLQFTYSTGDTQTIPLSGIGRMGSATSISGFYDPSSSTPRINYLSTDSHIHQFSVGAGAWHDFDLTAATGALTPVAGVSISAFADAAANTPRINYIAADSHVHQFLIARGAWRDFDLTAASGALNASPLSSLSGFADPAASSPRINYVASDSHMHQVYVGGGAWLDLDLTAATTGASTPAPYTSISGFFDTVATLPRINFVATDSHVHQFFLASGVWRNFDLTAATNAPNPATATAISAFIDTASNTPRINYVAVDSHVHQFFVSGGAWHDFDLTLATNAPLTAPSTSISGFFDSVSNTPRINYIGVDAHVHQFHVGAGAWRDYDITAATSGLNTSVGTPVSAFLDLSASSPRINSLSVDQHMHVTWIKNGAVWKDFDLTAATNALNATF